MALTTTEIRFIAGTLALLSWSSLLLQWTLMYTRMNYPTGQILARFFGYFTILSNTLVALSFSLWYAYPVVVLTSPGWATLFTAICVYIVIVAFIYHLLLARIAKFTGLDQLANAMLHTFLPIIYVICWQLLLPAGILDFNDIGYFLIFPILYLCYALLLGKLTDHYPYPFINVLELGYSKVGRNALLIALAFALFSCILIYWKM